MIATAILNKETGYNWMPVIPENWEIKRAKAIFQERSIKGFPDEPLLAASQKQGVVLKEMLEQRSMEAVQNFESFKLVEKDDFVISLRSFEGGIELAYYRGIIIPVYSIFYFRENKHNRDFFKYLFKSRMFIQELNVYKKGIRDGQSISYSEFANIYLPVPPKDEQDEIVLYIKAQEEKINRFIEKKQRFIELLKEQRLRVITIAVTKGVKNEQLKDSQVDWLGDIPKSWERTALKRLVKIKITDGPHESPVFADEGIPFVSAEASVNGRIDLNRKRCDISKELYEEFCKKAKAEFGDILMVKSGSTTGKIAIVDFHDEFSIWSPLALIRPNDNINNEFLFYSLSSNYFQKQVQLNWSFGTQPNIGMGKIEQLIVLYPNSIEEQKQIVTHIKAETATIDTAIAKAEREIELIKEYKEAMISEAVMGKRNK